MGELVAGMAENAGPVGQGICMNWMPSQAPSASQGGREIVRDATLKFHPDRLSAVGAGAHPWCRYLSPKDWPVGMPLSKQANPLGTQYPPRAIRKRRSSQSTGTVSWQFLRRALDAASGWKAS